MYINEDDDLDLLKNIFKPLDQNLSEEKIEE